MVTQAAARTIVGIIGNVTSFGLFLSPAPTFYRINKNRDVEEFQPYPYVATVINCALWVFYGMPFITEDSTLVITINGFGLGVELIYLIIFVISDKKGKCRKMVGLLLLLQVIFMAILVAITMLVFDKHKHRSLFVGVFCDIFNILMYSSPLTVMTKVIKTKSVEYLPFCLSLANFSSGCIWVVYAVIKLDKIILISNGLGAMAGAAQLLLYCWYRRYSNVDAVAPEPPPEIKLSEIRSSENEV